MRKPILYFCCCLSGLLLLTGCPNPYNSTAIDAWVGFVRNRPGTWQWVKTVTPSHVYTPLTEGYTQRLYTGTQEYGDTLIFYKDQTISRRLYKEESMYKTDNLDPKAGTMLTSYWDSTNTHRYYIKFFFDVAQGATTMRTSVPLLYLNPEYDSIRVYYQKQ